MVNISRLEEEILKFWDEHKIFEQSLSKDSPKGEYVFYDGPPFATGLPHYGHIAASLMKDMVPRHWTMRGYHVERKWGWDCHGLPIENIVEKELKLDSRKDIEALGVEKFNQSCHSKVMVYRDEWYKTIRRFGRWADMENDYKTMDKEFMESVWWVFKQLWEKGLIYEDYKSMHVCPRCETTLSQSEVAEGYKDVEDVAVTVKLKIKNPEKLPLTRSGDVNVYMLAWTTTPWTLPGNVALAVGEDIEYAALRSGKEIYIIADEARDRAEQFGQFDVQVFHSGPTVKGSGLVGLEYEALFRGVLNKEEKNFENAYKVYSADFVSTEDGTGIVHIAPAFGQDDMNLGKEKNLPFIQHVFMDGTIKPEVQEFAGKKVKPKGNPQETDLAIVEHLQAIGSVFAVEKYTHSYPHCWRCDTPLLNYATSSWFVAVTKIKHQLLENAKSINWIPEHIKEGRFGNWLEGARDWSISRQRYWGSVLPIWKCESVECKEIVVVGSIQELKDLSGVEATDLHKHIIDKITFGCKQCGGTMKRIPDVLDCWFESGSMPYAQLHYPFEHKEKFEANFPAQFIAEGADQTRCWFYYLHVLAGGVSGCAAFQNVIVNGIVVAEDGKKMSKRLKNYPEPDAMFEKYGADAVRYYLATSPVMRAGDVRFVEREVDEVVKKFSLILLNVLSFYQMYANDRKVGNIDTLAHVLDRWIVVKLYEVTDEITKGYDTYDLNRATRPLIEFVNELSTWYVRRSRDRFKAEGEDKEQALRALRFVLLEFSKLMAPVMPFLADHVYRALGGEQRSVHLEQWPEDTSRKLRVMNDKEILSNMAVTRKIVENALAKRAQLGIPVRQPLAKLTAINMTARRGFAQKVDTDLGGAYKDLIKDEVNVKEVVVEPWDGETTVVFDVLLDATISEELQKEGLVREITRLVNDLRKQQGLTIQDLVTVTYQGDAFVENVIEEYRERLQRATLAKEWKRGEMGETLRLKEHSLSVKLVR